MYASVTNALTTGKATQKPLLERAKWLFASPQAAKAKASAETIKALNAPVK